MKAPFLALALLVASSVEAYNETEVHMEIMDLIAENNATCLTTSCHPNIENCVALEKCGTNLLVLVNFTSLPEATVAVAAASLLSDSAGGPLLGCAVCSCGSTVQAIVGADTYALAQSVIPCTTSAPTSDNIISAASILLASLMAFAFF